MTRYILTLNAGSSSLKFGVFDPGGGQPVLCASGQVERIGTDPQLIAKRDGTTHESALPVSASQDGHEAAVAAILAWLAAAFPGATFPAIGHRIVHGGPDRSESAILRPEDISELSKLEAFAPLHQPHNLAGVRAAAAAFPDALQVGCFDTAFHRGHPWVNDVFALPRDLTDRGVRRYGFHGLSYAYVADVLARDHPDLHAGRVVVAHLGNGASACGIRGGRSVASTMGFTALDGLPMGTRCGQIDPGVLLYLMEQSGMAPGDITNLLYSQSGLKGLSGESNDMRTLEASGSQQAKQAIEYFVARLTREIAALAADLGGLDAVVFTGGIGENSVTVRRNTCAGLAWLGLSFDDAANTAGDRIISTPDSPVTALIIPTNEEIVIARETVKHAELGG